MILDEKWCDFLDEVVTSKRFSDLSLEVEKLYESTTIFPKYENIFRAFNLLTPDKVKVVIIGQDPYHGAKQANGLAFSVCDTCAIPPSLQNIFKELTDDIACKKPINGNLTKWSEEGVLLMNAILTVEEAKANSHKKIGWEYFTDSVIKELSTKFSHLVFILWGAQAQKKSTLIDTRKHLILKSVHPSPLSAYRGFFGSKPFSKTNRYLLEHHKVAIDWSLD